MTLTPEHQEEIEYHLYQEESREETIRTISRWNSEQLHAFMLEYNWDDGFAIPRAALDHPGCERGTALLMLWAMGGPLADDPEDHPLRGDALVFFTDVKDRLLKRSFPENEIAYDPVTHPQTNERHFSELRQAGVPDELMRPSRPR